MNVCRNNMSTDQIKMKRYTLIRQCPFKLTTTLLYFNTSTQVKASRVRKHTYSFVSNLFSFRSCLVSLPQQKSVLANNKSISIWRTLRETKMTWHPLLHFLSFEIILSDFASRLLRFPVANKDMGLFHFDLNTCTLLTDSRLDLPCTFHQLQDIGGYFPPMTFLSQVPQTRYWGRATKVKESRNAYWILHSGKTNIRGQSSLKLQDRMLSVYMYKTSET